MNRTVRCSELPTHQQSVSGDAYSVNLGVMPYLRFLRNCIRWRSVDLARWALAYEREEARQS